MSQDYKFEGWVGLDKNAMGNMKWQEYEPKPFEETDVDVQISHSGICGSDIHTLRSGWGKTDYPCVVGHEIVGKVVRAGSKVDGGLKVGDIVGIGAQSASCLKPDCYECTHDQEQHCLVSYSDTFNDKFSDGSKAYGGYAKYWRGPSHFAIKIPSGVPLESAAPMMCGGITTFAPLQEHGAGPGKRVGIIGIGGLGHFGLLWAKALGCDEVVAISRTSAKKEDALKMGATKFIATAEDKDWASASAQSLDLIVSTVSSPKMPLQEYLSLLRVHGKFVQVGAPEDVIPPFNAFDLILKRASIYGSKIGSPAQIRQMLDLAAEKQVHGWIETRPMSEANEAVVDMEDGKARYRYTLLN